MGTFLSRDPLGFSGGDANFYRYCGGNPINSTDPSGMDVYSQNVVGYSTTVNDPSVSGSGGWSAGVGLRAPTMQLLPSDLVWNGPLANECRAPTMELRPGDLVWNGPLANECRAPTMEIQPGELVGDGPFVNECRAPTMQLLPDDLVLERLLRQRIPCPDDGVAPEDIRTSGPVISEFAVATKPAPFGIPTRTIRDYWSGMAPGYFIPGDRNKILGGLHVLVSRGVFLSLPPVLRGYLATAKGIDIILDDDPTYAHATVGGGEFWVGTIPPKSIIGPAGCGTCVGVILIPPRGSGKPTMVLSFWWG